MGKLLVISLMIFFICCCISNGQDETSIKGVILKDSKWPIRSGFKLKIVVQYTNEKDVFIDTLVHGKNDIWCEQGDSVLVKLNKRGKPTIVDVFYKAHPSKVVMVSTEDVNKQSNDSGSNNEIVAISHVKSKKSFGVSYYLTEKKPLFMNAKTYVENDSLISTYIRSKANSNIISKLNGVAATISINEKGKVVCVKVFDTGLPKVNQFLEETLLRMPNWKPGKYKGNLVTVSYNVTVE